MLRGFRVRCYPTKEQAVAIEKTFGACRYVYNWALETRSKAWLNEKKRLSTFDLNPRLTQLKKTQECAWLKDASAAALQVELFNLQSAFVSFWEKRSNYPSFKSKRDRQSFKVARNGFYWNGCDASIFKIGRLKTRGPRNFTDNPTSITVSRDNAGRYFMSFLVDEQLQSMPPAQNSGVGIDVGLTAFATLSTGEKVILPKSIKAKRSQLRKAHKELSRKQKGSKNREKSRVKLARIWERIADTRKDFLHKLSTRLVRENQTIAVEDLNVLGMMKNHKLARSISEQGWGEFSRQLEYKCKWYGREFVKVDRFFPSSKTCSKCGHVVQKMPLNVRSWTCPECDAKHDRDINAAINILAAGHAVLACGDSVRPKRSKDRSGNRQRSRNSSLAA